MEIIKTLVLNTVHLTRKVADLLDTGKENSRAYGRLGVSWDSVEYGWLIRNVRRIASGEDKQVPRCIRDICTLAHANKCGMVLLDCDGETNEQLRSYDW